MVAGKGSLATTKRMGMEESLLHLTCLIRRPSLALTRNFDEQITSLAGGQHKSKHKKNLPAPKKGKAIGQTNNMPEKRKSAA